MDRGQITCVDLCAVLFKQLNEGDQRVGRNIDCKLRHISFEMSDTDLLAESARSVHHVRVLHYCCMIAQTSHQAARFFSCESSRFIKNNSTPCLYLKQQLNLAERI